jgi:hypothetical protein
VRQVIERLRKLAASRAEDIAVNECPPEAECDDCNTVRALRDGAEALEALTAQPSEVERLTKALAREEACHSTTIDERDRAQDAADELANRIVALVGAGDEVEAIGEHTSANNPWQRAIELADEHIESSASHPAPSERIRALRVFWTNDTGLTPMPAHARERFPDFGWLRWKEVRAILDESDDAGQNAVDALPPAPEVKDATPVPILDELHAILAHHGTVSRLPQHYSLVTDLVQWAARACRQSKPDTKDAIPPGPERATATSSKRLRGMLADAWWNGAMYAGERSCHAMKQACDVMLQRTEADASPVKEER